ncbi:MAG: LTA synthase family protein [Oceanococcus sp.]
MSEFRTQYGHMLRFLLLCVASLSVIRVGLVTANFARLEPQLLPTLMLQGLRFDLILIGYLCVIPCLISLLCPVARWPQAQTFMRVWYRLALFFVITMEFLGFGFLVEYDHRPDGLFWEYLSYPQEVISMLWGGFKLEGLVVVFGMLLAWFLGRQFLVSESRAQGASPSARAIFGLFSCVLLFLMIRSTLGHRPANISSAIFSTNRLANELALNSLYTTGYALYARKNEGDQKLVPAMPIMQALQHIEQATLSQPLPKTNPQLPSLHTVSPSEQRQRPMNVVVVLEESLGARFVGALGGAKLTPRLDDLSERGLWFTNLFATGSRTVRGIEAVLCGFPPSTARSVVKRNRSRRGFYALAQALKPHGYQSIFLYGGEANFDDMGSFMLGNGFDHIVAGEKSYPDAHFRGSWGVSDEDWALRAHQTFEKAQEQGPFFGFMLSTSNHTPWEFPDGRISPESEPLASRANAVRYADYALGYFFDMALNSNYAKDTVFLVVADHEARVAGNDMVPVDRFRIPGLIIAPGLAPQHYQEIASQIDLLPTIMPMLGVPLQSPMIGRDLLAANLPKPGRAIMQYGSNVGLLWGDRMVVNTPGQSPVFFKLTAAGLQPATGGNDLEQLAAAYLNAADYFYTQRAYRMPDNP